MLGHRPRRQRRDARQDLDLASSPLGGIPLGGIALGGLPLGGIPLGGIAGYDRGPEPRRLVRLINQQPGFTCPNGARASPEQTMLGLALQGVPLGGIPLGGIPLGGIPLGGIPLGGIAVGTPLGGIPLGGINLAGTPLGGIPLGGIDMSLSPLGGIPLGGIPAGREVAIFNCPTGTFTCADTDTLAQAEGSRSDQADREAAGPRLLQGLRTAQRHHAQGSRQGPAAQHDARGSARPPILLKTAYDWEALPLPGFPLQDFSSDGGT